MSLVQSRLIVLFGIFFYMSQIPPFHCSWNIEWVGWGFFDPEFCSSLFQHFSGAHLGSQVWIFWFLFHRQSMQESSPSWKQFHGCSFFGYQFSLSSSQQTREMFQRLNTWVWFVLSCSGDKIQNYSQMVLFHLLLLISVYYITSSEKCPWCMIRLFFNEQDTLMSVFGHTHVFQEHSRAPMEQHSGVFMNHHCPQQKAAVGRNGFRCLPWRIRCCDVSESAHEQGGCPV